MKHRRPWLSTAPPAKRRRGLARPPPAKRQRSLYPRYDFKFGKVEIVLLLFETPSGFAIFDYCSAVTDQPDAMDIIWAGFAYNWNANHAVRLNQFQTFEDKSSAINLNTGVNKRLTEMIMKWHCPGQKMAVGKPEYKKAIEESLGIPCLHDPIVMELMWGIQRFMPSSVPQEKSQLNEEDRLPLSQGLQKFLRHHNCNVEPEMVNDKIIETAGDLFFRCDSIEKLNSVALCKAGELIKKFSGISCEGWSLLKIATALKIICWPEEAGNSCEMFSKGEVSKLLMDAPLYETELIMDSCLSIYNHMVHAHKVRTKEEAVLKSLIQEAKGSI